MSTCRWCNARPSVGRFSSLPARRWKQITFSGNGGAGRRRPCNGCAGLPSRAAPAISRADGSAFGFDVFDKYIIGTAILFAPDWQYISSHRMNTSETRQRERIPTELHPSADSACRGLAAEIAALIRERADQGRRAVLGLATGSTPVRLYRELIRLHREEGLSFKNVVTFNLDEYHGLARTHPESYWRFMHDQLFDHIDVPAENINVPDGTVPRAEVFASCKAYEDRIRDAGGLDLQIL